MKTKNKVVLLALCMVALIAVSVLGTMAYLTSTKTVENTFTVGKVEIKLDEAPVDTNGKKTTGDRVTTGNSYKLLPGLTYDKDPMVTVLSGSERSYIKMTVTFSNSSQLDAIFATAPADSQYMDGKHANLTKIFNGYDRSNWTYKSYTEGSDNTITYEFWYKEAVAATTTDFQLDALFDSITVPDFITNEQLATINNMKITVNAYAIQADGFADADDAWNHFN